MGATFRGLEDSRISLGLISLTGGVDCTFCRCVSSSAVESMEEDKEDEEVKGDPAGTCSAATMASYEGINIASAKAASVPNRIKVYIDKTIVVDTWRKRSTNLVTNMPFYGKCIRCWGKHLMEFSE